MRDIIWWWLKCQWGGQHVCPFCWIGPVIITWSHGGRWYTPRNVEFSFYPVPD